MRLKEQIWNCECGTVLRYGNKFQKDLHMKCKKHQQFLIHKTPFAEEFVQRTRKAIITNLEKE